MKATFKPLGLAIAVATASAGYAGIVNAQTLADNAGLGNLGIVPYYTVNSGYTTGVSVINTSPNTQVVKVRLRRAVDSMDALDFNVVLSPFDVWTGYVQQEPFNGEEFNEIRFYSNDKSCVVPDFTNENYFLMPETFRVGAEEGYIEIMGMASPLDEIQPIAISALHGPDGIPADCDRVRDNFFAGTTATDYYPTTAAALASTTRTRGVINSAITWQRATDPATGAVLSPATPVPSSYVAPDNVLKVSYFIKDDDTGIEFGNDAVHIADFLDGASMTNQERGINAGDLQGFDHPDLDGGAPTSFLEGWPLAASVGAYEPLRDQLGADQVINDWSGAVNDLFTVDTDWVVTTPGQYLMTNQAGYIDSIEEAAEGGDPAGVSTGALRCLPGTLPADSPAGPNAYVASTGANCDFRDIPLTVTATVWDREEREIDVTENELVVSPSPVIPPTIVNFNQEVNVVQWGTEPVLDSVKNIIIPKPAGAESGWAEVNVVTTKTEVGICEYTDYGVLPLPTACTSTSTPVPLVGFVAWQRNFDATPAANYGRIVEHSFAEE
ncbi:MAG: hypothetical protein P8J17_16825 [Halioglobus sp.]|nr:hypothetical protein [Halioglobus sp.]